jgi:hypothetical protein
MVFSIVVAGDASCQSLSSSFLKEVGRDTRVSVTAYRKIRDGGANYYCPIPAPALMWAVPSSIFTVWVSAFAGPPLKSEVATSKTTAILAIFCLLVSVVVCVFVLTLVYPIIRINASFFQRKRRILEPIFCPLLGSPSVSNRGLSCNLQNSLFKLIFRY